MIELGIVTRSKGRSSIANQLKGTVLLGLRTGIPKASSTARIMSEVQTSIMSSQRLSGGRKRESDSADISSIIRMSTRSMTKTPQRNCDYPQVLSLKPSPESSSSSLSIFTPEETSSSTLSSAPTSSPSSPPLKPTMGERVSRNRPQVSPLTRPSGVVKNRRALGPTRMLLSERTSDSSFSQDDINMGEALSDYSDMEEAELNSLIQNEQQITKSKAAQKRKRVVKAAKIQSLQNILTDPTIPGNLVSPGSNRGTDSALSSPRYYSEYGKFAFWSRLNAYELHPAEYEMLRRFINVTQATIYLNIRNKILKLWHNTLTTAITRDQAAECTNEPRFVELADVAWEFLVRHGYINYGCIDRPERPRSKKIVAIVGGGVSGLACARQLDYLFWQFRDRFPTPGDVPQVYLLEGRDRLGGRVYSHPLRSSPLPGADPSIPFLYNPRVDIGAQVITGLEGNPIAAIISQRDLEYHVLRPDCAVYDLDGEEVDQREDGKVEVLYNDSLDRVAVFKAQAPSRKTVRALNEMMIDEGRDPTAEGGRASIAEAEEVRDWLGTHDQDLAYLYKDSRPFSRPRPTAPSPEERNTKPAAEKMRKGGWVLKRGVKHDADVLAKRITDENGHAVLGKSMDNIFEQYRNMTDITPLHLRLLNWHHANNEYGNACHNDDLSLEYWDQDDGNSFEGPHVLLKGGYSGLVEALAEHPKPLSDVYTEVRVESIAYDPADLGKKVMIGFDNEAEAGSRDSLGVKTLDGNSIEVDKVVITSPLGCLKERQIKFAPELPDWKQHAIENMGFGLFNKVILVFDEPFWDMDADMFGTLREPLGDHMNLASYEANRGRFYMFWNVSKACGRPALVGLMVGEAAVQVEKTTDDVLVREAMELLSNIYSKERLPDPVEVLVTRWRQDPFSRGSYSFMGPSSCADDYDNMAKSVDGKLFFAGEATCRTHPATVHGAYISGLRAAEEVLRSYIGDIKVPDPLIMPKGFIEKRLKKILPAKRKAEDEPIGQYYKLKKQRLDGYRQECQAAAQDIYGEPPAKPAQPPDNPWMIFVKDNWGNAKNECDKAKRKSTRNPKAQASRDAVRKALSKRWENMTPREKAPYKRESRKGKETGDVGKSEYQRQLKEYEAQIRAYLEIYKRSFPCPLPTQDEQNARDKAELLIAEITRLCRLSGIQCTIDEAGNVITTRPELSSD